MGTSAYELAFARIAERVRGESLPHECAPAPVIDGSDAAVDIVVDFL